MVMDKTVKKIVESNNCTGCGSCFNKCPFHAIEMKEDNNGFLKPKIVENKCTKCNVCLRTCPVENPIYTNNNQENVICYAFEAEDKIRRNSSSGGAAALFALKILKQGGVVCGAVKENDNIHVNHKFISDPHDISLLQGSKYVQSNTKNTYEETKKYLMEGKKVLYIGCPCQIAGLKAYLDNKEYDNLITVDLICHGVPSVKTLKKYLVEKEQDLGEIADIQFRTKEHVPDGGWKRSVTLKLVKKNGDVVYEERSHCNYLNAFLKTISINQVCASCKFARIPRQGDITIGDFWEIDKYDKNLDDDKGTSVIIINNDAGKLFLESLKRKVKLLKEVPLEIAVKGNKQIIASPWVNPRGRRFYEIMDKYNFSKALDYSINRKFDIGYVGWWYGANYGSVLTNFALHEVLTKVLDKTVLMISYPNTDSRNENSKSSRFAVKHYETSMRRKIEDYKDLNWFCEKFVLGSDQLWNWYSINDTGHHFLLDWVNSDKIKIAYATSFGHSRSFFPEEERIRVGELFQEFNSISVRESEGVDILRHDFGVYADHTLDPVFLCPKEIYDEVAEQVPKLSEESYIFAYILNPTLEKKEAIYRAAKLLQKKVIILIDGQADNKNEFSIIMGEKDVLKEVEIEQWLRLIKDADFVITDSFHGTCFSIINHKKFIAIKNPKRGNSRFISLMELLKIENRLVDSAYDIAANDFEYLLYEKINYECVDKILQEEIQKDLNWLVDALEKPKQPKSYFALLLNMIKEQNRRINELENKFLNK